jgi:two-component system, NarL family, response regulator LiaR
MLPQDAGDQKQTTDVGTDRVRVVIADRDPLARRIVRDAFGAADGLVVVGEVSDGVEAVELVTHYKPDVLLIEPSLARLDGLEVLKTLRERTPDVHVVFFATRAPLELQMKALFSGASGFLSKELPLETVVERVRGVVGGEAAVSAETTLHLVRRLRAVPRAGLGMRPVRSGLTDREWEVLDLVSAGQTTKEVASELELTEDTVYSHAKHAMRKLGVQTLEDAVQAAHRLCSTGQSAAA